MHLSGKPTPVVSVVDPALDVSAMGGDIKPYIETRDPELIREKPGETAARYHCAGVLASVFESYVQQATTEKDAYIRAFAVGVTKITSLVDMKGVTHALVEPEDKIVVGGTEVPVFAKHQLNLIYPGVKLEVGAVIWSMSFLPPGENNYSPPPPSSLSVLAKRISQAAGATRSTAPAESNEKPPAEAPPESAKSGGKGTAATAKGRSSKGSKKKGTRSKPRRSSSG